MVRATQSAKSAARLSAQLVRTLREGALLVFGCLAFILWVALFTYDPADPGFTQASGSGEVNNAIGWTGALIADLLFNLFGRPAYLFTLMILYLGWMIYREQKTQQQLTRMDYTLRIGGFVATLITSCALASLHFSSAGFRESAGGIIGQVIGGGMESLMKLLGASTFLFFLWIASISVFLGISWFGVMDRIGKWSLIGWETGRAKIGVLRDKAEGRRKQAARQDTVEAEKIRTAGRAPPRIEPVLPTLEKSARAERERQVPLFEPPEAGELPPLSLLDDPPDHKGGYSEESLEAMSRLVELKLLDFGIEVPCGAAIFCAQ